MRQHAVPMILFIVGPTGTGKSDAAVRVAAAVGGEIVSADSMQFYRGMDVGTAKPGPAQREQVPHHLLDVADPDQPYNVARFYDDATRAIDGILRLGRLPLVVGGSGLYVRALSCKLDLPIAEPDDTLRRRLHETAKAQGPEFLHARLAAVDPASAGRIHPKDVKKVIRALEVYERTGRAISEEYRSKPEPTDRYECLMFGLTCNREELYRRVEERCDRMVNSGLLAEVQELLSRGYSPGLQSMQAIGYQEVAAFLRREIGFPEAVETFKRNTRRYVKRQLTWFKTDGRIHWLDVSECDPAEEILAELRQRGVAPA